MTTDNRNLEEMLKLKEAEVEALRRRIKQLEQQLYDLFPLGNTLANPYTLKQLRRGEQ